MKREDFKPYQPLFCLMVFAILGLGYYQEHVGRLTPQTEFPFPEVSALELIHLDVPGGNLTIAGQIFDFEGQPAPGVQISLLRVQPTPAGAEPLHWAVSDDQGRYEIYGLEALEYRMTLYLAGVPINADYGRIQLSADTQRDFHLAPPAPAVETMPDIERADLSGVVRPPAGRQLGAQPLKGYDLVARPLSPIGDLTGAVTRRTSLDASGLFTLRDLACGPYQLELLPPWASGGSWPVVGAMEWDHQAHPLGQDVLFPMQAGAVTGVVLDPAGRPIVGAVVLLWDEADASHVWPLSQTRADGRVTILDLPAGRYVARVRAGSASSEVSVEVLEGVTSGITFDALQPRAAPLGD